MPEYPTIFDHPSPPIQKLRTSIISLYNIVGFLCEEDEVNKYRNAIEEGVQRIIEGDFHGGDHLIHSVGVAINLKVNSKLK